MLPLSNYSKENNQKKFKKEKKKEKDEENIKVKLVVNREQSEKKEVTPLPAQETSLTSTFKVPLPPHFYTKRRKIIERKEVAYIYSPAYLLASNLLPIHKGRDILVQSLIEAYGLLEKLHVVKPRIAESWEIEEFHSSDYTYRLLSGDTSTQEESEIITNSQEETTSSEEQSIDSDEEEEYYEKKLEQMEHDLLEKWKHSSDDEGHNPGTHENLKEDEISFGLFHDCPPFKGIQQYCVSVAGAALTASHVLIKGEYKTVINWFGGRHHAKKDKAAGYCYINDIVLSILDMMCKFKRILYIDFDVHHGDGVEEAFYYTNRVMTLSFHHMSPGFYPGTGALNNVGKGKGKFFTINVPLKAGIGDVAYIDLVKHVLRAVKHNYKPHAIVVQCGCDAIAGDPLGAFNLTPRAIGECIKILKKFDIPMLVLGGGGYNACNVARTLAFITGVIVSDYEGIQSLSNDIPEHANLHFYKHNGFQLHISPDPGRKDENSKDYLATMKQHVIQNLTKIDY